MNASEIKNIEAEAGVIATVIKHPEYTFYSEQLRYTYFTDNTNGYVYYAVQELAKKEVKQIDAYNIMNILSGNKYTAQQTEANIPLDVLNDIINNAEYIARSSVEEYKVLVAAVISAAQRRTVLDKLRDCERYCFSGTEENLEQTIYKTLDDVMLEFSTTTDVPQFSTQVDRLWGEIEERQSSEHAGYPFKFEKLNEYVTIDPGELVIFAADAKQGKSIMLMNCTVDLMRQGKSVLYIDSELSSRTFLCRLIAHLTGIEFKRIKTGRYNAEEKDRIDKARGWIKKQKFTHIYLPMFDSQSIYTITKKVKHTQGIDVIIVDYFKGNGSNDAFMVYAELGKVVDIVKNQIAGDMDIAALGAVQATSTGKIADSSKIARNASTIILIENKTPEEIQHDGAQCGNKKLRVVFNRNGEQMTQDEYIDVQFNGNLISYEQAEQHKAEEPF